MSTFDLNIDNYELSDILALFNITDNITEESLKRAKKKTLMSHPDKSKLPKEYFLFFSKAYQILHKLYTFQNKIEKTETNTDYNVIVNNDSISSKEKKELLKKHKKNEDFSKWFNTMFEKLSEQDEDVKNGYGDWLKNETSKNIIDTNASKIEQQKQFENIKNNARQLVLHKQVETSHSHLSSGSSEIGGFKPTTYTAGFNNEQLDYQDVREAYDESLIPVNEQDFINKEKYNNLDEINRARGSQDTTPISLQQSKKLLNKQNEEHNSHATNVAYFLAKKEESSKKNNDIFWSSLRQIKY